MRATIRLVAAQLGMGDKKMALVDSTRRAFDYVNFTGRYQDTWLSFRPWVAYSEDQLRLARPEVLVGGNIAPVRPRPLAPPMSFGRYVATQKVTFAGAVCLGLACRELVPIAAAAQAHVIAPKIFAALFMPLFYDALVGRAHSRPIDMPHDDILRDGLCGALLEKLPFVMGDRAAEAGWTRVACACYLGATAGRLALQPARAVSCVVVSAFIGTAGVAGVVAIHLLFITSEGIHGIELVARKVIGKPRGERPFQEFCRSLMGFPSAVRRANAGQPRRPQAPPERQRRNGDIPRPPRVRPQRLEDLLWNDAAFLERQRARARRERQPRDIRRQYAAGVNVHDAGRPRRTQEALAALRQAYGRRDPAVGDADFRQFSREIGPFFAQLRRDGALEGNAPCGLPWIEAAQNALYRDNGGFFPRITSPNNTYMLPQEGDIGVPTAHIAGFVWYLLTSGRLQNPHDADRPEHARYLQKIVFVEQLAQCWDYGGHVCATGQTQQMLIAVQGFVGNFSIDEVPEDIAPENIAPHTFIQQELERFQVNGEPLDDNAARLAAERLEGQIMER